MADYQSEAKLEADLVTRLTGLGYAAVTLPDPKKAEQVVLLSEAPEAARTPILSWAQSHGVPEISVPRRVFRVAQIPVLGTGKVDYSAVRTEAERLMND